MKLDKPILLFSLIGLSLSAFATSSDNDFQKWLQQEKSSLQEFKDARDKEFTSFLEQQWKEMEIFSGVVRDSTPKPVKMPIAKPIQVKPAPTPVVIKPAPDSPPVIPDKPVIDVKPKTPPVTQKKLPIVVIPKIKPAKSPSPITPELITKLPKGKKINLGFFGNSLTFSLDHKFYLKFNNGKVIDSKNISTHWRELRKTNYEQAIKQLSKYKEPLQLNDWGYALLVNSLAKVIYPKNKNEQNLFTWFILLKSGYKARIAYDNAGIYMLFPTEQKIYGTPYFVFNAQRYYSLSFDGSRQKINGVFTYDGNYPNTDARFDMRLTKAINTKSNRKVRVLSFNYKRKNIIYKSP